MKIKDTESDDDSMNLDVLFQMFCMSLKPMIWPKHLMKYLFCMIVLLKTL